MSCRVANANANNNARLRELVRASGLPQPVAIAIFDRGLLAAGQPAGLWTAYLANPDASRFLPLGDDLLAHARRALAEHAAAAPSAPAIRPTLRPPLAPWGWA